MYEIKLPKVLFLALDIAQHYKKSFFNTSDLTKLANQYSTELVRTRADKKDYKYLQDTKFGGLRGNFSTLLTWRGLVKKGSTVAGYYSIGKDDRILNAVQKGEIVFQPFHSATPRNLVFSANEKTRFLEKSCLNRSKN